MADINHSFYSEASFEEIYEMFSTKIGLRQWWTSDVRGGEEVGDTITFGFGDEGEANFEIIESLPFEFLKWKYVGKETDQWFGTEIIVHLSTSGKEVKVNFHHNNFKENNAFFK